MTENSVIVDLAAMIGGRVVDELDVVIVVGVVCGSEAVCAVVGVSTGGCEFIVALSWSSDKETAA